MPHSSVEGLTEGTYQADDIRSGEPLGLNNHPKSVCAVEQQADYLNPGGRGFASPEVDKPLGEWNKLDIYVIEDSAECYFRNIRIRPITDFPAVVRKEANL